MSKQSYVVNFFNGYLIEKAIIIVIFTKSHPYNRKTIKINYNNDNSNYANKNDMIDKAKNKAAVNSLIVDAAIELTNKVNLCQKKFNYSPHIRKCVAYINKNLNEKLTVNSVAKYCNLSSDYLSRIFKEEMGVNLSAYITHQKLEMSQTLLFEGYDSDNICYLLGFSSQSHYISLFKKEYGITPGEFVALTR